MGTSLQNLQVYNPGQKLKYELEDDYCVINLVDNWDTIIEDDIFVECEDISKEAEKLSLRIDTPVISVQYIDDDFLTIDVFSSGKRISHYYLGIDEREIDNVNILMKAFHLEPSLELVFRRAIKAIYYAWDGIHYIGNLCRVPLWTDTYSDEPNSYKFEDLSKIVDEINTMM